MKTDEIEIPEWIDSRIDIPDNNRSITQYQVVKEFVENTRPYYNVSRMHATLGGNVSTDTVQSRMDELVERDVLKSEKVNNGYIYWLNNEESAWPVPSDVEVEPERTEPTVSEWKKQGHIQLAALSFISIMIGTAVTLFGTFQAGGYYTTPWGANEIIAVGLSTGILSYFGLFVAGLVWIFDIDELPDSKSLF